MEQEQKHIGYEVHTLDRMIGQLINSLFEKEGLTMAQSWIIGFLYEHQEETIFQKNLEAHFHMARSTATGVLQGMEKHGLLMREAVASDARLKRLVLTEKGVQLQIATMENFVRLEQILKEGIPREELPLFFETMEKIRDNVSRSLKEGPPFCTRPACPGPCEPDPEKAPEN